MSIIIFVQPHHPHYLQQPLLGFWSEMKWGKVEQRAEWFGASGAGLPASGIKKIKTEGRKKDVGHCLHHEGREEEKKRV